MNSQKGSALLYAMIAVGLVTTLTAIITRQGVISMKESKLMQKRLARNSLGRDIASSLTNPSTILASIKPEITNQGALIGNQWLSKCIGFINNNLIDSDDSGSTNNCDLSVFANKKDGVPFLLVSEFENVGIPQDGRKVANSNCPRPNHISCFIAGSRNQETVGYSFYGDSGQANVKFPLEVKVFFLPVCNKQKKVNKCTFAEAIKFRYEITQIKDPNKNEYVLGKYPKKNTWLSVDTIDIVGLQCNEGAIAYSSGVGGKLSCRCQRPYTPKVDKNGDPVTNARGPLCNAQEELCPTGFMLTGRLDDGTPNCELMKNLVVNTKTLHYNSLGHEIKGTSGWGIRDCNENNDGGWVSNILRECSSYIKFKEVSCPEGCGNVWPSVIGAGIGLLLSFVVAAVMAVYFPPAGVPWLVAIGIDLACIGGGAMAGYLVGENWDWIYVDEDRGIYADIDCNVDIQCSAPRIGK